MKNIECQDILKDIAIDISHMSDEMCSEISWDMGRRGAFVGVNEVIKWLNEEHEQEEL